MLKFLLIGLFLSSCGLPEFSPWQESVPESNLTQKHLDWLKENEGDSDSIKIAITGDTQAVIGHFRDIINITNDSDFDFIVVLGDLTDLGLRQEWMWFGNSIAKSTKPVLTVVGNHDGLAAGDSMYRKMFGDLNYSFTYRGVKFIMWNNNYYEWGDPDFEWLEKETTTPMSVVIMSHQPPGSGTLKDHHEKRWKKIRDRSNVVASIHGHQHSYGYVVEDGGTQVYTVERVIDEHFGMVEIGKSVVFSNCKPKCERVTK